VNAQVAFLHCFLSFPQPSARNSQGVDTIRSVMLPCHRPALRRSFGFAGALLSGVAFRKLAMVMRAIGNVRVEGGGLVLGALGFFAYSAFGGLIVTTVARQPVQIFRALG